MLKIFTKGLLLAMVLAGTSKAQIQLNPRWGQRIATSPLNVEVFQAAQTQPVTLYSSQVAPLLPELHH